MAALTLTEGRDQVLDFLDDQTGARFNADGLFTKVDKALSSALSRCVADYVGAAGDNFNEEAAATTSASTGSADLSSLGAIDIRHVLQNLSPSFGKIRPIRRQDREYIDLTQRTLVVSYVREYVLPTNAGFPLVGNVAVAANTWPAFDNWVCARAALQAGIKNDELRQALVALEADCRESALARIKVPRSSEWPGPGNPWTADLGWTYLKTTSTLQLVRLS